MSAWMLALAGGVLIGLSATLLLWLDGRVAGVSGLFNGVLFPAPGDVTWRLAFLVGLVWKLIHGEVPDVITVALFSTGVNFLGLALMGDLINSHRYR